MRHDDLCELTRNRGHGCQCGSRACPLCDGCKGGNHLAHDLEFTTTVGSVKTVTACACPTCVVTT